MNQFVCVQAVETLGAKLGVDAVFLKGTSLDEIATRLRVIHEQKSRTHFKP